MGLPSVREEFLRVVTVKRVLLDVRECTKQYEVLQR